jgi:RNA polymerase sigma-70 factor (ECF subfamily)
VDARSPCGREREDAGRVAFELGRRRWPDLALDPEVFAVFAQSAGLEAGGDGVGDALLAYACAAGDPRAIALFEAHMVPVAARAIARVQSHASVDETLQLFRQKFLLGTPPAIARFRGHAPLCAWLRVAATRMALDHLRGRRAADQPVDELAERLLAGGLDPELGLLIEGMRDTLTQALAAAIRQLSARDRLLLRMHFEEGLSIDRLAAPAGVHRATVARWINAARDQVTARVLRDLGRRYPDLERSSLGRLLRAVRSQFEVNFSSLFAEPGRERPQRTSEPA